MTADFTLQGLVLSDKLCENSLLDNLRKCNVLFEVIGLDVKFLLFDSAKKTDELGIDLNSSVMDFITFDALLKNFSKSDQQRQLSKLNPIPEEIFKKCTSEEQRAVVELLKTDPIYKVFAFLKPFGVGVDDPQTQFSLKNMQHHYIQSVFNGIIFTLDKKPIILPNRLVLNNQLLKKHMTDLPLFLCVGPIEALLAENGDNLCTGPFEALLADRNVFLPSTEPWKTVHVEEECEKVSAIYGEESITKRHYVANITYGACFCFGKPPTTSKGMLIEIKKKVLKNLPSNVLPEYQFVVAVCELGMVLNALPAFHVDCDGDRLQINDYRWSVGKWEWETVEVREDLPEDFFEKNLQADMKDISLSLSETIDFKSFKAGLIEKYNQFVDEESLKAALEENLVSLEEVYNLMKDTNLLHDESLLPDLERHLLDVVLDSIFKKTDLSAGKKGEIQIEKGSKNELIQLQQNVAKMIIENIEKFKTKSGAALREEVEKEMQAYRKSVQKAVAVKKEKKKTKKENLAKIRDKLTADELTKNMKLFLRWIPFIKQIENLIKPVASFEDMEQFKTSFAEPYNELFRNTKKRVSDVLKTKQSLKVYRELMDEAKIEVNFVKENVDLMVEAFLKKISTGVLQLATDLSEINHTQEEKVSDESLKNIFKSYASLRQIWNSKLDAVDGVEDLLRREFSTDYVNQKKLQLQDLLKTKEKEIVDLYKKFSERSVLRTLQIKRLMSFSDSELKIEGNDDEKKPKKQKATVVIHSVSLPHKKTFEEQYVETSKKLEKVSFKPQIEKQTLSEDTFSSMKEYIGKLFFQNTNALWGIINKSTDIRQMEDWISSYYKRFAAAVERETATYLRNPQVSELKYQELKNFQDKANFFVAKKLKEMKEVKKQLETQSEDKIMEKKPESVNPSETPELLTSDAKNLIQAIEDAAVEEENLLQTKATEFIGAFKQKVDEKKKEADFQDSLKKGSILLGLNNIKVGFNDQFRQMEQEQVAKLTEKFSQKITEMVEETHDKVKHLTTAVGTLRQNLKVENTNVDELKAKLNAKQTEIGLLSNDEGQQEALQRAKEEADKFTADISEIDETIKTLIEKKIPEMENKLLEAENKRQNVPIVHQYLEKCLLTRVNSIRDNIQPYAENLHDEMQSMIDNLSQMQYSFSHRRPGFKSKLLSDDKSLCDISVESKPDSGSHTKRKRKVKTVSQLQSNLDS